MIQVVSQYGAWPVVSGREQEIKPALDLLATRAGIKLITLGHDYMRLQNTPELVGELAVLFFDLAPDIVFCQWEQDNNQDHVAAGEAARIAAIHGACFLSHPPGAYPVPSEIYHYRGDAQTRNYRPDTYVDVTSVLHDLLQRCSLFDNIYGKHIPSATRRVTVVDHLAVDRTVALSWHTEQKFATSLTDGYQCGVRFAEGFHAYQARCVGRQALAQLDAQAQ